MPVNKQRIALLGSTGSIGEQTLDVISANEELFELVTITANRNWEKLARQAVRFMPDSVVIADKSCYADLSDALRPYPIKVYAGIESVCQIIEGDSVDTVVNALVGYAGLKPTISAVSTGKKLALANKESLVVAGEHVIDLSRQYKAPIIPIDSEHSAIFQCLVGEICPIKKLILTASGGPFLNTDKQQLESVTVAQTLAHPNWSMGAKITVDSATMLNKGFEVIEAKWLFGIDVSRIEVVVHPQSVIHSMVEFEDGALKAQLGTPDMRLPIQYALTFPKRIPLHGQPFDITEYGKLTFLSPDTEKFPALGLAYEALRRAGTAPCTLNAANEVAVEAFLAGRIGFTDITRVIEKTIGEADFSAKPTIEDYRLCDEQSRRIASQYI